MEFSFIQIFAEEGNSIMFDDIEKKAGTVLLLLPGFLSATIIGMIVDLGQLNEFQIIFYSLVLSFVIICIVFPMYWIIESSFNLNLKNNPGKTIFLTITVGTSIFLGVGIGVAAEKDIFFVTLRTLPIFDVLNKRSSNRPLVFLLSQNSAGKLKMEGDARTENKVTEAWVRLTLDSGEVYEGWPEFYGLGDAKSELYLSPACRLTINDANSAEKVPGPGVLIFESNVKFIEFVDRPSSPCYNLWFP
jgi:Family of unknown function (DUF6338)